MPKGGSPSQQSQSGNWGISNQYQFPSNQGTGNYSIIISDKDNNVDRIFTAGGSISVPLKPSNPDRHEAIRKQLHATAGQGKDPGHLTDIYGARNDRGVFGTYGSNIPTDITGGLTNVSDLDTHGLASTDVIYGDDFLAGLSHDFVNQNISSSAKLRTAKNKAKELARKEFQNTVGPYTALYVAAQVSPEEIKFPSWMDEYVTGATRALVDYEQSVSAATSVKDVLKVKLQISGFVSTDAGAGAVDSTDETDDQPVYDTVGIETDYNTDKLSAQDTDAITDSTGADSTDKARTDFETKRDSTGLSTDSHTGLVPSEFTAKDATDLPADARTDHFSYQQTDHGTQGSDISDRDSTDVSTKKGTDYLAQTDRDATSIASHQETDKDETKLSTGAETDSTNQGHPTLHYTFLDTDQDAKDLPTDFSDIHTDLGSDLKETNFLDGSGVASDMVVPVGTDISDRDSTDAKTGKETHVDATYASTGSETDHFSFRQTDHGTEGTDSTQQPGQVVGIATYLSTDNETQASDATELVTEGLKDSNISTNAETDISTSPDTVISTDQVFVDATELLSARHTETDHFSALQTDHMAASTERLSGTDDTDRDSTDMKTHLDDTERTDFSDLHTNRRTDHKSNIDTDLGTDGTDHTYSPLDSTDLNTEDTIGKSDGVHIVHMDTAGYQGSDGKTDLSDIETNIRYDYDSDITTDQATATDSVTDEDGTSHYGGPTDHQSHMDTERNTYGTQNTASLETDHKTDKKSEDDTDRSSELGTNNTVFDATDLASEIETLHRSDLDTDNVTHGTSGHTDHKTDKKSEDDTERSSDYGTGGDATDLHHTDRTDHLSYQQTGHATENTRRLGGSDETDRDSTDIDTSVDFNIDDQTDYSGVGTDTDRKKTDSTVLEKGSDDHFSDKHTLSGTDHGTYGDTERHTHGTINTEHITDLATDQKTALIVNPHTDGSDVHTGGYSNRANTDHFTGQATQTTDMDTDYATHGTRDTGQVTVFATDEVTDKFTDHLTFRMTDKGTDGTHGTGWGGTHGDSTDHHTKFNTDDTGPTEGASTHEV